MSNSTGSALGCDTAIKRVLAGTHKSDDLGFLISFFSSGSNPEPLRKLLTSNDNGAVTDGAYILSEIGSAGRGLLDIASSLVEHRDPQIRYWAFNSVMVCAPKEFVTNLIAKLELLSDEFDLVRQRAAAFLARQGAGSGDALPHIS